MARTRRNVVRALACIARAASAWLILFAASAHASAPLEVMAFDGQPVPGGAPGLVYTGFSNPVVNAAGGVAFWGFVSDPQLAIGGSGLFGPDANGDPTLIALDFEQVPGMLPGTEFRFTGTYFPRLDGAGAVAFRAGLSGPGVQYPANSGIWGWNAESGLALLAIGGDPVPDVGPGATLGQIPSSIGNPTITSEADVDFYGSFDDGSGSSLTGSFAVDEAGALTLVAGAGFDVPGIPGATFTWVGPAVANRLGERGVGGFFDGPGVTDENGNASFRWDAEGGLTLLVRSGDPAPGTAPGVVYDGPGTPLLNDAGQFAFLTQLVGPGVSDDNRTALYGPNGSGDLALLARQGDPAPGTEPGTLFEPIHDFVFNAAGQTAFTVELIGPSVSSSNAFGIWWFDPTANALELRVREGDPAPELPGLALKNVSNPILNDRGDLVFHANLEGPGVTPDTNMGIFAIEGDGTARKVLRTGDLASFGPGDLRPLNGISLYTGSLTELPGMAQLSDTGYLTFWAHTSGANAIVVTRLPEPGVVAGLAAGLLLLGGLHKARALRTRSVRSRRARHRDARAGRP